MSVNERSIEMYDDGFRPTKATETRWIDNKIHAMNVL